MFNKTVTKCTCQFTTPSGLVTVDERHGLRVIASEFRAHGHHSTTLHIDPESLIEIADMLDAYRNRSLWSRIFG